MQNFRHLVSIIKKNPKVADPLKVKKLNISKSYINNNIKLLIKEKHRLQRLFNKKPLTYGNQYRAARNHLNAVIRTAKSKYFQR